MAAFVTHREREQEREREEERIRCLCVIVELVDLFNFNRWMLLK